MLRPIAAYASSEFFLRAEYIVGQGWTDLKDSTPLAYTNWGDYIKDAVEAGAMPAAGFASETNLWKPAPLDWTQQVFCQRKIT